MHADDRIGAARLTKAAERQLEELDHDERRRVVELLEYIDDQDDVYQLGFYVSESPAGSVWRLRSGRVGVFMAVDDDELLVVGLSVRRGGMEWF